MHDACRLVRDHHKPARAFAKLLGKDGGLTAPAGLVWELDVRSSPKKVAKQLADEPPQVLVFDTDPLAAKAFLATHLSTNPIPVVLTPRAYGEALGRQQRHVFVIQALSAGQVATDSQFRRDYERDHGVPGFAVAEGFEAVQALAQAFDAADSRESAAVRGALQQVVIDGVRTPFGFDRQLQAFAPPLGVWIVGEDRLQPYSPPLVALSGQTVDGTATSAETVPPPAPQTGIGVRFGTWRTRNFQWEEGSQWVLCLWADDDGFATANSDLEQLGLSTGGADPLVDHLVKEEIMARVMAIASSKYGRREDGSAIPGKSLRICFGSVIDPKLRKKKKQRLWPARFGGDHAGAGGQAFGTYCRVYTSFIRRTTFQEHALSPPVSAADREFLDGTYRFGANFDQDRRSELIRALINGYAGSMALTLAHEVGHLAGLGHVTDDPVAIMNVEEGSGIDYPDAKFVASSWASMEKRLGVVEQTSAKRRKR